MKSNTFYVIVLGIALVIMGSIVAFSVINNKKAPVVTNYNDCVLAGYPILETSPEMCKTPDGQTFTRPTDGAADDASQDPTGGTGTNTISDLIRIDAPQSNATVGSPLVITGKARGNFFFEASFPVKLVDQKGNILAQGHAQAEGDWMTNDFVPFKATLNFSVPAGVDSGTLILHNDNPSGMPENNKELRVPLKFAETTAYTSFGSQAVMNVGDKIYFSDSLVVSLKTIEDSRCKANVVCIWAGELAPVLLVGKAQSEVRLGTVTKQSVVFGNYTFALKNATESTATIVVTKN